MYANLYLNICYRNYISINENSNFVKQKKLLMPNIVLTLY